MFEKIIAFVLLVVGVTFWVTFHSAGTARNNIILGVKLPVGVLKRQEVLALAKSYKKGVRRIFFVFIILALPLFEFYYTSFILLYLSLWCTAYYLAGSKFYQNYFETLLVMKSENKWFPIDDEYHVLSTEEEPTGVYRFWRKLVPDRRKKLLQEAAAPIYVDEDEYWIDGYYRNPSDPKKMVEKRYGFGTTPNMAHKSNRLLYYGTFLFIIVLIGGLSLLFLRMDFATFRMTIQKEEISIDAPIYAYRFKTADIVDVTITDSLPEQGIRTNGAATSTYYLGNFRFENYGKAKVFLYIKYPPYIVLRLQDNTVFFNTKSAEETNEYYRQLVYLVEGRSE